jgi:RND family efflux transporter MFP subunit
MGSQSVGSVIDGISTLFDLGTVTSTSDADLLKRYLCSRDGSGETAFAALVARHGPMVLRVCRGVLRESHDADDAFQATFLILARKAGSIRGGGSVASWLHGVARRVAVRARAERIRRAERERSAGARAVNHDPAPHESALALEIQEEVDRLPEKYRAAVVLCDLEGLSDEEAAGVLRIPLGTVKIRLSRARKRLRGRLVRRGLAPALLPVASGSRSGAAIPILLADSTIDAAMQVAAGRAAGVSAPVAALAKGALRIMMFSQLKSLAALLGVTLSLVLASTLALSLLQRPVRSDPVRQTQEQVAEKKTRTEAPAPRQAEKAITQTVERSDYARTTSQQATLRAFETAAVYPAVSGTIKKVNFDLGDRVHRGAVMAEIDAPELALDLAEAKAVVEREQARLTKAEAMIALARSKTGRAPGQPPLDLNMREGRAQSSADAAAGRAELQVVRAQLKVALAGLHKAESRLRGTTILAPFDGVVIQRQCHEGEVVLPGTDRRPAPLLTIAQTNRMRVFVNVPYSDIPLLDIGDPATVSLGGRAFDCQVSRIAGSVDSTTGMLLAQIEIENADGRLRDGMVAGATIVLEKYPNAITIPSSAIVVPSPDKVGCFRVLNGHAVWTPITVGWNDGKRVEVLDGLKVGDEVIVKSVQEIKDGQAVEPAK